MHAKDKDLLLKAYQKIFNPDLNSLENYNDCLQDLVLTMLERDDKETLNPWPFESLSNMERYLKGAMKKGLLKLDQSLSNAIVSFEEITEKGIEKKTDLFNEVVYPAKHKNQKPLFDDTEKALIKAYYEQGKTLKEIGKELNVKGSYHKRAMQAKRLLDKVNRKIATLPLRGLHGWIETDGIDQPCHYWPDTDILTDLRPLKRYRRSEDLDDLKAFRAEQKKAFRKHSKQGADIGTIHKQGNISPYTLPLTTRPIEKPFKVFTITRKVKDYGNKTYKVKEVYSVFTGKDYETTKGIPLGLTLKIEVKENPAIETLFRQRERQLKGKRQRPKVNRSGLFHLLLHIGVIDLDE